MKVKRNGIYRTTMLDPETSIRVLLTIPENDIAVVISLSKKDTLPYCVSLSDLQADVNEGILDYVKENSNQGDLNKLLDSERFSLERDWGMISEFVSDIPNCFDKNIRSAFIKECCKSYGITRTQVQRVLYRYWAGGMTKNALVLNFRGRGGAGQQRKLSEHRIGRPVQTITPNTRIQIGEKERKRIETVINKTYNKKSTYSINNAYHVLLRTYYIERDTGDLVDAYPTFSQFSYHSKKYIDEAKHIGERKFNLNMRGLTGSSRQLADGPGEQYQIDATIADYYLVASYDRKKVIGRPVLYIITDVFSRMITGFHVGIKGPSWESAMMALSYAFMNKVELCKTFGIDISEEDWPCEGIPYRILTDNGELVSKNSNNLANKLLITMQNAPSYRADMKGIVEQCFHQANNSMKSIVPGAVQPDHGTRGSHDNRLDAVLTIYEFSQLIILYILKANSRQLSKPPQMANDILIDKVPPIPIELWKWGQENRTGFLLVKNTEEIMMDLLPSATAVVTEKGIRYNKIHYICPTATEKNWFSKARVKGTWRCNIKYDPRDLSHIILIHEDGRYEWCGRTPADAECYLGWYAEEVDERQEYDRSMIATGYDRNLRNDLNFEIQAEKIKKNALDQKNKSSVCLASTKMDIKNIEQNRKIEVKYISKKESLTPKQNAPIVPSESYQKIDIVDLGYSPITARLQKEKDVND